MQGLTVARFLYLVFLILATVWLAGQNLSLANLFITVVVLVIAVATLDAMTPKPAKIWVERQHELGLSDLLFFDRDIPTDFLLQMHVAVANVGGRKGILSGLFLDDLLDGQGHSIRLHRLPYPLAAQVARQTTRYMIGKEGFAYQEYATEIGGPPLILEPDDVITLRFRARRGINWADDWTLDEIKKLAASLARPVVKGRIRAVYRRGRSVESRVFTVDCSTVGQDLYLERLKNLTSSLTVRPAIEKQVLDLE